jgi:cytochrome c6
MKKLAILAFAMVVCAAVSAYAGEVKENWAKQCAKCHGEDGKGQAAMGKKLGVKDYTDAKVQEKLKDEEMAKAIKEGVKDGDGKTKMKGFGDVLSDDEIKALVKHIRAFKS